MLAGLSRGIARIRRLPRKRIFKAGEGVACEPISGPPIQRYSAQFAVELNCRPVPVEHGPLEPTAAPLNSDSGKTPKERETNAAAAKVGLYVEILQINSGLREERGIGLEEYGEARAFVFPLREEHLGCGSGSEQGLAELFFGRGHGVRELFVVGERANQLEDERYVRLGGGGDPKFRHRDKCIEAVPASEHEHVSNRTGEPAIAFESRGIGGSSGTGDCGRGAECAGIVCFPECFVPGYRRPGTKIRTPTRCSSTLHGKGSGAPPRANIAVVPGTERVVYRAVLIAALVVDSDGTIAGFQDKVQLERSEECTYSPGCERRIFKRATFHEAEPGSFKPTSFGDPRNSFHEKAGAQGGREYVLRGYGKLRELRLADHLGSGAAARDAAQLSAVPQRRTAGDRYRS